MSNCKSNRDDQSKQRKSHEKHDKNNKVIKARLGDAPDSRLVQRVEKGIKRIFKKQK